MKPEPTQLETLKKREKELGKLLLNATDKDFDNTLRDLRNLENKIYRLENPIDYRKDKAPATRGITQNKVSFNSQLNQ